MVKKSGDTINKFSVVMDKGIFSVEARDLTQAFRNPCNLDWTTKTFSKIYLKALSKMQLFFIKQRYKVSVFIQ